MWWVKKVGTVSEDEVEWCNKSRTNSSGLLVFYVYVCPGTSNK